MKHTSVIFATVSNSYFKPQDAYSNRRENESESSSGDSFGYDSGSGSGNRDLLESDVLEDSQDTEEDSTALNISVYLPPAVFENVTTPTVGLLFTYYREAFLFPLSKQSESDALAAASPVIGISLAGYNISFASEPILLTLPVMVVS